MHQRGVTSTKLPSSKTACWRQRRETMSTKPVAENSCSQGQSERRTRPRYALVTSIRAHAKCPDRVIRSQGMTVEISEGGVSAYLRGEFEAGQQVELELDLPTGPLELSAIVKNCLGTVT